MGVEGQHHHAPSPLVWVVLAEVEGPEGGAAARVDGASGGVAVGVAGAGVLGVGADGPERAGPKGVGPAAGCWGSGQLGSPGTRPALTVSAQSPPGPPGTGSGSHPH